MLINWVKKMEIRRVIDGDVEVITALYNTYVQETLVSFETVPLDTSTMLERIRSKLVKYEWLVAYEGADFLGYAYFGEFRGRAAYDGTVESSVYLGDSAVGRGVATALYDELIQRAKNRGFRQMIGVITLPNDKSEALHQRMGFESVGVLRGVGRKFERDADVALWQLSL